MTKIFLLAIVAMFLVGCGGATTQVDPSTSSVKSTTDERRPRDDAKHTITFQLPGEEPITLTTERSHDEGSIKIHEEAAGQGAGLRTSADKNVGDFNASAPTSGLGNGRTATGATTDTSWKLTTMQSLWSNPCLWIGILCLLGAGALAFFRFPVRAVVIAATVGIGLIMIAVMPGAVFFVVAAGIAIIAGPYIVAEWKAKKGMAGMEALRATTAGISDLNNPDHPGYDPAIFKKVTALIDSQADERDKATIKEVVKKDDLKP